MKKVRVKLGSRSYDIIIGKMVIGVLGRQLLKLKIGSDAYIITNSFLKKKYGHLLARSLAKDGISWRFKCIADSEQSKSMENAAALIREIAAFDRQKRVFIIAFGGGVVGDLAGFVASVYKRGVPYIQVPTTLLAQVDSGIGGKTAVDLALGKNLVGAFYQPRLTLSDTQFLKTLNRRQLSSGIAEVIKYALIKDSRFFSYLEKRSKAVLRKEYSALAHIVHSCSLVKAKIVSQDERERKGLRMLLNFGHTIGHAIEAAADYSRYNHGEAIAMGMLAESEISRDLGLIPDVHLCRIRKLIRDYGLPLKIKGISTKRIIEAHYRDKKFSGKSNKFVLLSSIGRAKLVRDIPLEVIKRGIESIS